MRQGNGAEILGSNDPRSGTIGVIDVAPNDDREGIVAAIVTQDKLGRQQIVLNLPAENKAFQRPVDFDGLKNMRRKLQAQLIIIAPGGSAPAEFARQRRFPLFYSKEGFRQSLGGDPSAEEQPRRGGVFGAGRARLQSVEEPRAATNGSHAPQFEPIVPMPIDAVQMSSPAPAGVNGSIDQEDTLAPPPEQDEANMPMPEPIPLFPRSPHSPQPYNQTNTAPDVPEQEPDDEEQGGSPIPFILPIPAGRPQTPPANQPEGYGTAPFAAAGGAAAPTTIGGGTIPPAPGMPGGGTPPPRRPRSRGQLLLLALVALLLLSLMVCGGIALAAPGVFPSFGKAVSQVVSGAPAATVTITPSSKQVSSNFTVFAVLSAPSSGQRQVQARNLTYTTPASTKPGTATGHAQNPATNATGSLTFYNGSTSVQVVNADTIFNVSGGTQIENTGRAVIPAGNPPNSYGSITVGARAITSGSKGNISAYTLRGAACCGGPISVSNTSAFGGGRDAQNYKFVQQSDVSNVAAPMQAQLTTQAMSSLVGLKHTGEQFVHEPTCSTNVTSNPAVGTHVTNTTISVTVTATCKGEVYDASGAQTLAAQLLVQQETTNLGPHFAPVGSVQKGQPSITGISKSGTIDLAVTAQGVWVYQFSDKDTQNLAKLIAGKSKAQAQAILLQQSGVAQVISISIANNGTTLPTDPTQIKIVVQGVPGLPGVTPTVSPSTTGTPGQPSGTPVSSPTQGNG